MIEWSEGVRMFPIYVALVSGVIAIYYEYMLRSSSKREDYINNKFRGKAYNKLDSLPIENMLTEKGKSIHRKMVRFYVIFFVGFLYLIFIVLYDQYFG